MTVIDSLLEKFVDGYGWIHTSIGLIGNICFVIGSLMFMSPAWKPIAVWFFLAGSSGMLVGTLGNAIAMELDRRWRRQHEQRKREVSH